MSIWVNLLHYFMIQQRCVAFQASINCKLNTNNWLYIANILEVMWCVS
jgi:hypothetical protein